MKTTIKEIADRAGVSPATVDRVLNDRPGVRQRTRDAVLGAAERLGYFGEVEVTPQKSLRLLLILPEGENSFMQSLRRHLLVQAQETEDVSIQIRNVPAKEPAGYVEALRNASGTCEGVGIIAPDHPEIREEINQLARTGIKVSTLVSDIPAVSKIGYVGVDNRAAGRLAGLLMGRFLPAGQPGRIGLFIGSPSYRGHEEREMGFRSILSGDFPELRVVDFAVIEDDRDNAYREARRLLAQDDLVGIYNIGSGNQGIAQAVKEMGRAKDLVFIAHDFTEATRTLLLDRTIDAIIDQNPRVEAREVIRNLVAAIRGEMEPEYPPRLQAIFRENMPAS
ncbi:LacI family DNA-binding transcriptional regulator [Psychromarinibacter halotolerans]|uniref:LacI family DNA-binding transcriptional regulator n=1 Tax=Psychromarinibacter halotolerans TaxID=1775175 RepID=A0ABV7GY06_9RHOB|nr:LacI family DNA-binding transcriptional regulator [Psychromarinibacter halotolerans]MDF0597682.1 LacI family DNA-binding transcriptional regulator [Psychromarinibacter halotolerans]